MSMCTWDCETTTRQHLKRKASPFHPDNYVVAHAFKNQRAGGIVSRYFGRTRPASGWLREVLAGTSLLVGMNIKFDISHALTDADNRRAWNQWVAGGGMVWDVQLAEYLLGGMSQEHQILSLDELAVRYGQTLKLDEVKLLWAAGVDTPDIDPDLLMAYLAGGTHKGEAVAGDVQVTEAVALKQIAKARARGQLNSILLNCNALIAVAECEQNGMFVDMPLAESLRAEVLAELKQAESDLAQHMPKDLPEGLEFNWSSRFHKSAILFGGTVSYPRREYDLADGTTTFTAPTPETAELYLFATKEEVQPVLDAAGQPVVYGSGKNKGMVKTKKVKVPDHSKPKGRMSKDTYRFPQLVKPRKEWASSDPGVWSTGSEVIELLQGQHPLIVAFKARQSLSKDLGTYYYSEDEDGVRKGMLTLVGDDGLIHHKINQTATVTGRLSSSDPNL